MLRLTKEINIKDSVNYQEKIKAYFLYYNFKIKTISENNLEFYKKGSLFVDWKLNPLNWKSSCSITKKEAETLEIKYSNDGNTSLTPNGFEFVFQNFVDNIDFAIHNKKDFKSSNQQKVTLAKKIIIVSFLIAIIGVIIGGFLGNYLSTIIGGGKFISYLGMYICATGALKLVNIYLSKKKFN